MFFTGTPEFAFGSGLSYTTWEMSWERQGKLKSSRTVNNIEEEQEEEKRKELVWPLSHVRSSDSIGKSQQSEIAITLKNSGKIRAGRQTVLLFWRPTKHSNSSVKHLRQKLIGYKSTPSELKPGQSAPLFFHVGPESLAIHVGGSPEARIHPGEYELFASIGDGSEIVQKVRIVV